VFLSRGGRSPEALVIPAGILGSSFRTIRPQVLDFEEGDALVAAFEKALPVAFALDLHTEEVDVEFSCAREILDVKNYVVDTGDFKRGFHGHLQQ
jgi:hypothetical protein